MSIHDCWNLQFKVDFELLMANRLFTLRVCARNPVKESHQRNIFSYFILLDGSDREIVANLLPTGPLRLLGWQKFQHFFFKKR